MTMHSAHQLGGILYQDSSNQVSVATSRALKILVYQWTDLLETIIDNLAKFQCKCIQYTRIVFTHKTFPI